jgi:hypothetical protein
VIACRCFFSSSPIASRCHLWSRARGKEQQALCGVKLPSDHALKKSQKSLFLRRLDFLSLIGHVAVAMPCGARLSRAKRSCLFGTWILIVI